MKPILWLVFVAVLGTVAYAEEEVKFELNPYDGRPTEHKLGEALGVRKSKNSKKSKKSKSKKLKRKGQRKAFKKSGYDDPSLYSVPRLPVPITLPPVKPQKSGKTIPPDNAAKLHNEKELKTVISKAQPNSKHFRLVQNRYYQQTNKNNDALAKKKFLTNRRNHFNQLRRNGQFAESYEGNLATQELTKRFGRPAGRRHFYSHNGQNQNGKNAKITNTIENLPNEIPETNYPTYPITEDGDANRRRFFDFKRRRSQKGRGTNGFYGRRSPYFIPPRFTRTGGRLRPEDYDYDDDYYAAQQRGKTKSKHSDKQAKQWVNFY